MISVEFLVTSLVVVLIPGTGVVYTVSTALIQGRGASVYAALGCTAGIVPHLLATVVGLAAVMHTSAVAFYGFVAHAFRQLVIESARVQRWLRNGFALAFAGLGAKLALSEK